MYFSPLDLKSWNKGWIDFRLDWQVEIKNEFNTLKLIRNVNLNPTKLKTVNSQPEPDRWIARLGSGRLVGQVRNCRPCSQDLFFSFLFFIWWGRSTNKHGGFPFKKLRILIPDSNLWPSTCWGQNTECLWTICRVNEPGVIDPDNKLPVSKSVTVGFGKLAIFSSWKAYPYPWDPQLLGGDGRPSSTWDWPDRAGYGLFL